MIKQSITPDKWNDFARQKNGSILQTSPWGELKAAFGWSYDIATLTNDDGEIKAGALVLFRRLPLGLGTIAYVPRGPVVDWQDQDQLQQLLSAIDSLARKRRAILLKLEPDHIDQPELRARLQENGFRESPQTIQPPRTIVIDVNAPDDDILARMSQSTRRKVRLSLRRDVHIYEGAQQDIQHFNHLVQATGQRNQFGVHSSAYYHKAFDLFQPDRVVLLMAEYEGTPLGGILVYRLGNRAWYFYGASSSKERQRMATYGLQWAAIQWARENDCMLYDLWGIPDENEETLEAQFKDRHDGLWGVYGFKRGFGGKVVRSVGAWDRPYKPFWYQLYQLAISFRTGA